MGVTSAQILKLYKSLLTEASKFPSYNFRMYTLRRIRDRFSENKHVAENKLIEELYTEGFQSLELIKRQVIIASIFKSDQLIIEKIRNQTPAS